MTHKRRKVRESRTNKRLRTMKTTSVPHERRKRPKPLSPSQLSRLRLRVGLEAVLSQPSYADAIDPYRE